MSTDSGPPGRRRPKGEEPPPPIAAAAEPIPDPFPPVAPVEAPVPPPAPTGRSLRDRVTKGRAPDFITLDSETAACVVRMLQILELGTLGEAMDWKEFERLKRHHWVQHFFTNVDLANLPKPR